MLTIYYDADCGFCVRWATRFKKILKLTEANLIPAQQAYETYKTMRIQHSWIVRDISGEYYRYEAFTRLLKHSPRFSFLYPLATNYIVYKLGEAYYKRVSRRRSFL